jgi:hypothetical protein
MERGLCAFHVAYVDSGIESDPTRRDPHRNWVNDREARQSRTWGLP